MMKRALFPLRIVVCASSLLAVTSIFAQVDSPVSGPLKPGATPETVNIDWQAVTGLNQPASPEQTGVEVICTLNGKETTVFMSAEADTSLWKDSDNVNGEAGGMILRDNRFSEGLIRLHLDALPKNAQITKASLRFKVQGVQNKGQAGTFNCFRILTPWSEGATWHKPMPDAAAQWNGLQPGKDFDAAAFATLAVPSLDDKAAGGQVVLVPGFADALKHWQDGSWPNQGFLLTLTGKALQLSIPAREAAKNVKSLLLGGPGDALVVLTPNLPMLSQLLLKPDDLLGAQIRVSIKANPAQLASGTLKVYAVKGEDTAPARRELLGGFPLKDLPAKGPGATVEIGEPMKTWLRAGGSGTNFLLACEGAAGTVELANNGGHSDLAVKIRAYPAAKLFNVPLRPKDGVWTRVVDGHLNYGGKRLRLWGVVGFPDAERLVDMGFNAQRVWEPSVKVGPGKSYSVEGVKRGEMEAYVKGDGSQLDLADKHFADLKAHGMFVMLGALVGGLPLDSLLLDGSFVSGGNDWAQWKEAIQNKTGDNPGHYIFVDERLQRSKLQHAKNLLAHVNQYTGKSYGQEENIAIYEVYNENGFLVSVLGGGLKKWPPYFKDKLQARWNAWLVKQYANDDGLKKAWGKLDAAESLSQGTVHPGPDFEDRLKYPEKRGGDLVRFMIELEDDFNQKFVAFCRAQAPAGTGVNVVPFSLDTMYRPSLQWTYSSTLGDVFSMGMYFWELKSQLEKPPGAYVIDSFTPVKKPVVLYETNISRPDPFRAEYPLKLAALASSQDWDGIFWHYWGPVEGEGQLPYLTGTLAPPVPTHYWTAVHHENDPVMCTTMALGSRIFLGEYLPPAPAPDTIKVGGQALYSYGSFRGIGLARETFSKGSRVEFAPKDNSGLTENGGPMPPPARLEHAVANGKYVTWDWPNGRLIIDAPNVKAYVGRTNGLFRFSDGITFGNVSTPWVAFAMESADGKPLAGPQATSRILMGAVYDAKNTGFAFDYNVVGGPMEQAKAVTNRGHPPVLVDKVEYSVWFPRTVEGTFKDFDFALREMRSQPITKGDQVAQQGATPFLSVLDVSAWGEAGGTPPVAQATRIDTENRAPTANNATGAAATGLRAADLQFPIPGMDWGMDYSSAHRFVQDSPLVFTTLSPTDTTTSPTKTLAITDLQLGAFWNNTADATVTFQNNRMTQVDVTLKAPPPVSDVITQFSAFLGEPGEKKLDAQYGTTRVSWKGRNKAPDLLVTESQGIMKLLFQARNSGMHPLLSHQRQVHLDFHTSPFIPDVGSEFDATAFARTVKAAHVNSITVFAKCHHGMCYYPTKTGTAHPALGGLDLLGEQIEALHREGIRCPIYTTVGWEEDVAQKHPEWRQTKKDGTFARMGNPDHGKPPQPGGWRFNNHLHPDYQDYMEAHVREIFERYDVDGIFFDIVFFEEHSCWSDSAVRFREKHGLLGEGKEVYPRFQMLSQTAFVNRFTPLVRGLKPDATIFYNAPSPVHADSRFSLRLRLPLQTHWELESLPSGFWGYHHLPRLARMIGGLDVPWMGQTGRFQKMWGDFGGLKPQPALEYECFRSQALGGANSVGDQLPPRGTLDAGAYDLIGAVYEQCAAAEPFYGGSKALPQIGIVAPGDTTLADRTTDLALEGAILMCDEAHYDSVVLDDLSDLAGLELILLPDSVVVTPALAAKLSAYLRAGGKLLLSHRSGFDADGASVIGGIALRRTGVAAKFPTYWRTKPDFDRALSRSDRVVYLQGDEIEAAGCAVLVERVLPYFNRTDLHFSSHFQTPPQALADSHPAVVQGPGFIYFADPVFREYRQSGNIAVRDGWKAAARRLIGPAKFGDGLATTILCVPRRRGNDLLLTLLHYIPTRKAIDIDMIEERTPFAGQTLRLPPSAKTVRVFGSGEQLPASADGFILPAAAAGRLLLEAPGFFTT